MTLTFKDPNGREWELRARRVDYGDSRFAEPADLLAALGQLSTGSDGPTDEELEALFDKTWQPVYEANKEGGPAGDMADKAGNRALFTAGLALGEQKQAARVAELERENEEIHEELDGWRDNADLSMRAKLEGATHDAERWMGRAEAAESELASTKARLAEAERELKQARHVAAGSADNTKRLFCELASARRVVEAVTDAWARYQRNDLSREEFEGFIAERFETSSPGYALASGTDADRTEAPRPEAGESDIPQCARCPHPFHPFHECAARDGGTAHACGCIWSGYRLELREPPEEPKPEPQPSGFALPWHVEHVRSIRDERGQPVVSSVLDADGKRVASLVTPGHAAFIVARCDGSPQRQPHVESGESGDGEQRR